ncbi:MAG TPA: hypothetical protein VN805_02300 [Caulobacteraceae bacterium]|nr:hypothetical protein [Caulobacteraceae bacterium]
MTPDTRSIITDLAGRMAMVFAPDLKSPYMAGSAGLTAAVLMMVAEEGDRTAHRLVEENRAIRAILTSAATADPPADLAARIRTLAAGGDDDLHVSALQAANNELRAALSDLQAHVETRADAAAKTLNAAIWSELVASTGRRAFSNMGF